MFAASLYFREQDVICHCRGQDLLNKLAIKFEKMGQHLMAAGKIDHKQNG
jgi:hypothetical protein